MAQVTVRGLDDKIVRNLRNRAASQGRTLQSELRRILEVESRINPEAARKLAERIQRKFKGRHFEDSAKLLREIRGE